VHSYKDVSTTVFPRNIILHSLLLLPYLPHNPPLYPGDKVQRTITPLRPYQIQCAPLPIHYHTQPHHHCRKNQAAPPINLLPKEHKHPTSVSHLLCRIVYLDTIYHTFPATPPPEKTQPTAQTGTSPSGTQYTISRRAPARRSCTHSTTHLWPLPLGGGTFAGRER
jgi:hypothetical protein